MRLPFRAFLRIVVAQEGVTAEANLFHVPAHVVFITDDFSGGVFYRLHFVFLSRSL